MRKASTRVLSIVVPIALFIAMIAPGVAAQNSTSPVDPNSVMLSLAAIYATGGMPLSVQAADLNGDGKLDLVESNFNSWKGSAGVLLGNGDGTFRPVAVYDSGGWSDANTSVAIGDFNDDGKPDLVLVNSASGSIGVLLGNGDGTFRPPSVIALGCAGGYYGGAATAANINQDNKSDLVVIDACFASSVIVFLSKGDGSFESPVWYQPAGWGAISIAVSDVNGDGKTDIVAASWFSALTDFYTQGTVSVFLNNGDGTLQPATGYILNQNGYSVAVGDVNGDGHPDLVVATGGKDYGDKEGAIEVLLGNGDGTFQSSRRFDSGGLQAMSVAIADMNGDGKPDIIAANASSDSIGVLLGLGDGSFQPAITFGTGGSSPQSIVVTDLNGDGKMDVIAANFSSMNVSVLLQTGTAPTTTTLTSSLNPAPIRKLVTYAANVSSRDGSEVSGWISFVDGNSTVATVPVSHNQAAYSTKYKKGGAHTITALYSGDAQNAGSNSALTEYIQSYGSKTALITSGSPSHVGEPVTFTATVTSKHGTVPDGELITFYDGSKVLGSVALMSDQAAYTTSSLSAKKHTIKASYPGDSDYKASKDNVIQVVEK